MAQESADVVNVDVGSKDDVVEREMEAQNGPAVEAAATSLNMDSTPPRDALRRTSGKIANLRAAFEKKDDGTSNHSAQWPSPRRSDRSLGTSSDQDASITLLKQEHSRELAKLKEEYEADLVRATELQQQEIAQLKDQLERELDLRQSYEEKCTTLENEIDALQSQLLSQDTQDQSDTAQNHCGKAQAQEDESIFRQQIFDLKRTIASATYIENQVSDSKFVQDFQELAHEVQNWVVNNFRRVQTDKSPEEMVARLESIVEPRQFQHLRPIYNAFDSSIKIASLQATVACYMMEIWEEPLLFGLPAQQDWRKGLRRAVEAMPSVLAPATFNRWRATTLDALRQSEAISTSMDSAVASLSEMICITLNTLTDAESSDAKLASLNTIVTRAVSLSHLFRIQRSPYQFQLPVTGDVFSFQTMEDISIDTEPTEERIVRFATHPCITKLSDETGDNIESSQVVVKAKVICNG